MGYKGYYLLEPEILLVAKDINAEILLLTYVFKVKKIRENVPDVNRGYTAETSTGRSYRRNRQFLRHSTKFRDDKDIHFKSVVPDVKPRPSNGESHFESNSNCNS